MKLTIIEKAKAYDEALERAKNFIENGDEGERTIAESIFAGIMDESEDERIRKDIVAAVETYGDFTQGRKEEIYTWLEKQSTWKPSDEQLNSLYDVLNPCDGLSREVLESLYVQLKELKGE